MNTKEKTCPACKTCKHYTTYRPAWQNGGYGLCQIKKVINKPDQNCDLHSPVTPPRQARDCDGSPLKVGDCVSPANYPGASSEAPVYTITRICTDDSTVQLRRSDGSTLWETASCLLYLPEATRRANLATLFRSEPGWQPGCGPLFSSGHLVELHGQGTRVFAVGTVESWQLLDPKDGGPVTLHHNVLLEQESDPAAPILQPFVARLPLFKPGMQLILRGFNRRGRHIALAGEVTAYHRHLVDPFAMFTFTSTLPTASPDPEFYFST